MALEAPPTPKICNGKRNKTENDSSYCLQLSLKRMKVTTASPGELRLQRDFKHAVCCAGWVPVGGCFHAWKVPPPLGNNEQCYTVKQCIENPLKLVVMNSSKKWTVWLSIPRLYPHHPPILSRIECPSPFDAIIQAGPEDPQVELARKRGAVIVRGWSPLMRLHEILSQLMIPLLEEPFDHNDYFMEEPIEQQRNNNNNNRRHWYAEADCATESRDHSQCSSLPRSMNDQHTIIFPRNRFDLGYRRDYDEENYEEISLMRMHE